MLEAAEAGGGEPGKPARHRCYLAAMSAVPSTEDSWMIALVLRDPDRVAAESTVLAQVDHRASQLRSAASFAAWTATISELLDPGSFIMRRIEEWQLFKRVVEGGDVDAAALADSSNWLQRKVVEETTSVPALTAIGQAGRTRRLRNLARTKAGRLRQRNAP
ncbi:MAG: hypothetical protein QOI74_930 [Micromonosporaceae bacterium]|nr:hypothetical protein [Micromonosporaceae bacterium]